MPKGEIAVIGGSGFIGSRLVERLIAHGYHVRIIGRHRRATPDGSTFFPADVADRDGIFAAVRGVEAVFYLATGGGSRWSDFERDFLDGARNVADACLSHGVKRLVYTSSIAALYLGGKAPVTNATPADKAPGKRGFYARAKVLAEAALERKHRDDGLPVVIVRPGVVVGRSGLVEHSGAGYWPCDLCCIGWGRGKTPLPFVLVDDVAAALHLAMETPSIEGRAFNVAGDVFLSAGEYVKLLAERSLRNYRFYPRSLAVLQAIEIAKWALKGAAGKQGNQFPSFRDLRSRSLRAPIDCSDTKQTLGWAPNRSAEVFVREAIDAGRRGIAAGDLRVAIPAQIRA